MRWRKRILWFIGLLILLALALIVKDWRSYPVLVVWVPIPFVWKKAGRRLSRWIHS